MTKEISTANALGARTTRPCDSCIRRRARVYCVADDAFLCASCDSSVHSANPLARRHQRLPLTSLPPLDSPPFTSPSWTHRKPRTPRTKPVISKSGRIRDDVTHVPDLYEMHNSEEDLSEGNYDDLLYQVPVFDPDLAELYQVPAEEIKQEICNVEVKANQVDGVAGFHISEMDLDEFAADMESLLGGPEFEGLMDMDVEGDTEICKGGDLVENREKERKEMMLKLDYEDVISAWGCKGCSPWTNGERPRLGLDDCWPEFKVTNGRRADVVGPMYRTTLTNEGREARVSRYREKRRTRLFAKKIRYEVRKLNAEKRPRMKGRFVKRASLTTLPVPAQMKMQLPVPVPVMPGHFSF